MFGNFARVLDIEMRHIEKDEYMMNWWRRGGGDILGGGGARDLHSIW
jgi:hypothetical protein